MSDGNNENNTTRSGPSPIVNVSPYVAQLLEMFQASQEHMLSTIKDSNQVVINALSNLLQQ